MTDQPLDPDLQARLRASADERIAAQIAAAKQRRTQQTATRTEFAQNRAAGLRSRHALRAARIRLTQRHQEGGDTQ